MPCPGLTDVYEFGEWLKVGYAKAGHPRLNIKSENGGLITVSIVPPRKSHIELYEEEAHATEQKQVEGSSQPEHQNGGCCGQACEAGRGDSPKRSEEAQTSHEVKWPGILRDLSDAELEGRTVLELHAPLNLRSFVLGPPPTEVIRVRVAPDGSETREVRHINQPTEHSVWTPDGWKEPSE